MRERGPIVVINPRSDAAFVTMTEELVVAGTHSAPELQRQLRDKYPRAVVRERGLAGETRATWYVYREGTWVPRES
jgi:hypothetical protein